MSEGSRRVTLADLLPDEGIEAVRKALGDVREGRAADIHRALMAALDPWRDHLADQEVDQAYLAYAIEALATTPEDPSHPVPGDRVRVFGGDGETPLGEGVYEGEVPVYFVEHAAGHITSLENAEEEPPADMVPPGSHVVKLPSNPKIRLDSGRVVYGCQVWWEPVR